MTNIIRYSGIAALSLSLIMLSLGSIPQTYAGSVGSSMTVATSCSTLPSGVLDWSTATDVNLNDLLDSASPPAGATITAQIANSGSGRALISMGVGDDQAGGGYAENGVTHIEAASILLGLGDIGSTPFLVAMVDDTSVPVGWVDSTTTDPIDAQVTVTAVNLPSTSPDWVLTIEITQTECLVL